MTRTVIRRAGVIAFTVIAGALIVTAVWMREWPPASAPSEQPVRVERPVITVNAPQETTSSSSPVSVIGTSGSALDADVTTREGADARDIATLRARNLLVPVEGVNAEALAPSFSQARAGHTHEALDIPAARGTPVLAVEAGRIAKLFTSQPGGLTIYHFDPTEHYVYYYAHLDRYALDLHEGVQVQRGQVIGYVGSTGNASPNAPHLHFAVMKLGPERRWWQGQALDPFRIWRDAPSQVR